MNENPDCCSFCRDTNLISFFYSMADFFRLNVSDTTRLISNMVGIRWFIGTFLRGKVGSMPE